MKNINKFQKKALENVGKYYDGLLIVKYNLESLNIETGIDWGYKSRENSRTYQVYLHSLPFIKDFLSAGNLTAKSKYYKEARKLILSWYNDNTTDTQKWNEHAVSTRIKNIIDFQETEHNYKLNKKIYNQLVNEHCDFLSDEKNYKRNNHGLMMDISLIYSCSVLDDEQLKQVYLEKAKYRIRFAFYRDFSRKGVHLENSPEYHRLVLALYRKLNDALARHDLKMDKDINIMVENAKNYKKHIIKPDMSFPLIGDTGLIYEKNLNKSYKDFIDYEAGILIINNEDKLNKLESAYLTFKAGYQNKTHKHLDDLGITYYNFGQDILIDSGKYSYNQQDSIRQFLISPNAHNTISIKGETYKLTEPLQDQHKLKITRYIKERNYKAVTGINNLYAGVAITRHTILTNEDMVCQQNIRQFL